MAYRLVQLLMTGTQATVTDYVWATIRITCLRFFGGCSCALPMLSVKDNAFVDGSASDDALRETR